MSRADIKITSTGITRLAKSLRAMAPEMEKVVEAEIAATAIDIERTAAQWAPNDLSFLRQSIKAEKRLSMEWQVSAQVYYAPFVEFGTGTEVKIPKGLERYARQFKRPRPVKREVNLPARPFFFPAYRKGVKELNDRLGKLLVEAMKKKL